MQTASPRDMPYPVRCARVIVTVSATAWLFVFLLGVLKGRPVTYGALTLPGPRLMTQGWGLLYALGVVAFVLAYGLWYQRPWVRPTFLWVITWQTIWSDAFDLMRQHPWDWLALLIRTAAVALCVWYLYGNTSGRRYFTALARRAAA